MEENNFLINKISDLTKEFLIKILEICLQNCCSVFSLTISQFEKLLLIYDSGYEKFKNDADYEAAFYFLRKQEIFINHCDFDCTTRQEFYYAIKQRNIAKDIINQRFPNLWFDLKKKYSKECSADLRIAKIEFNERWVVTKSIQARCDIFFRELLKEHEINLGELEDAKYQDLSFKSEIFSDVEADDDDDDDEDIQEREYGIDLPDNFDVISPQNEEYQEIFNYTEDEKTGGKIINIPSVGMENSESDESSSLSQVVLHSVGKQNYEKPLSPEKKADDPQPSTSSASSICELIKTQQDKEKIINDGFMYVRSRPASSTWRCDLRNKEKCSATITTKFEDNVYEIIKRNYEHTHLKDFKRCSMQKSANKVTAYARSLGKPTAGLVLKKLRENPDYKPHASDKRKIQRIRKKVGKNIANCGLKQNKKKE